MKRNGFTLIELLVVVAIIGILAAVGVVAYSGYTSGAKINVSTQNCSNIVKWVQGEFFKCNTGAQQNIDYFDKNGNIVKVSCTLTGKKHSKYWKDHFEFQGFSNSINPSWVYMRESTNHIPPNGCLNFHCAVGSNTDNQCSFYCNSGALDEFGNTKYPERLKSYLIERE